MRTDERNSESKRRKETRDELGIVCPQKSERLKERRIMYV